MVLLLPIPWIVKARVVCCLLLELLIDFLKVINLLLQLLGCLLRVIAVAIYLSFPNNFLQLFILSPDVPDSTIILEIWVFSILSDANYAGGFFIHLFDIL
jgi:hypothetical protein